MKLVRTMASAAAVLGVTALAMSAAQASDGTLTFNGTITDQTCTIGGQGADQTITLPTVSKNTLTTAGQTTGATKFQLALTGCTATNADGNPTQVSAYFEAGSSVNLNDDNLKNVSGSATNVEVQLANDDGSLISIGEKAGTASNSKFVAVDSNGAATLSYLAQYYATGQTTAGSVNTFVTYSLQYL